MYVCISRVVFFWQCFGIYRANIWFVAKWWKIDKSVRTLKILKHFMDPLEQFWSESTDLAIFKKFTDFHSPLTYFLPFILHFRYVNHWIEYNEASIIPNQIEILPFYWKNEHFFTNFGHFRHDFTFFSYCMYFYYSKILNLALNLLRINELCHLVLNYFEYFHLIYVFFSLFDSFHRTNFSRSLALQYLWLLILEFQYYFDELSVK